MYSKVHGVKFKKLSSFYFPVIKKIVFLIKFKSSGVRFKHHQAYSLLVHGESRFLSSCF
jgi:hypothetical protein